MVEKFILKFHHLSDHDEIAWKQGGRKTQMKRTMFSKDSKIEGTCLTLRTPLCVAFYEFNYLLKINAGMVRIGSMTYFQDHRWYDELVDGKLKEETLALKAKIKGSWGDATLGVMKFYKWLKDSFENFHEIDYNVLVKLQECWWKVNAHKIALFTRMEKLRRGPYANKKIEWVSNPYLDVNVYLEEIMKQATSVTLKRIKDMKNKMVIQTLNHRTAKSGDSR
ncbi:hypothetical protein Tco_0658589 [Tanacetum coccineum]